jgi:hypothetical protein
MLALLKSLLLAAGMCTVFAVFARAQDLTPDQTQFQWDHWEIKINSLELATSVTRFKEATAPADDSLFVVLRLTVKNSDHYGKTFVPQNDIKIVIGEDAFDAADLDEHSEYIHNIEPTLIRERDCYFEVPKAVFKDSFTLQFSGLLIEPQDIHVSISAPKATPTPTPVVETTPEPESSPAAEVTAVAPPEMNATPMATPVPRLKQKERSVPTQDELLILDVQKAINDHDWRTLTAYTADGEVNYFGRLNTTNEYIRQDMQQDMQTYSSSHSIRYLNTFNRETAGNRVYDSITVYSEIQERRGRLHKALTRLTVGYTLTNGVPAIYFFELKVLGNRPL